jgi:hypothetical protein
MSFTSCDFFYKNIAPKMVELFRDFDPEEPEGKVYDGFKEILRECFNEGSYEKFQADMMNVLVINPESNLTIDVAIQKFFDIFAYDEEMTLRKLEYASGGSIINVDYEGVYREEQE